MKKIVSIICVIMMLLAFTACGYKVQNTKIATSDEIAAFFEGKEDIEEGSYKFKLTEKSEDVTSTDRTAKNLKVKGYVNYKSDGSYSLEYKAKVTAKSKSATVEGIDKGKYSISEKGVVFRKELFEKTGFYETTVKIDLDDTKENYTTKSTLEMDNELLYAVPMVTSLSEYLLAIKANYKGYVFIDGDKISYVNYESSGFSFEYHMVEVVFAYDGSRCKSARISMENANESYECVYTFGEYKEIKEPKDKTEYKTAE